MTIELLFTVAVCIALIAGILGYEVGIRQATNHHDFIEQLGLILEELRHEH